MKVMILGLGQDGSYLADFLLENTNYEIYGLTRSSCKYKPNGSKFYFDNVDVSVLEALCFYVAKHKPDYLFNFAAQSNPSSENHSETYEINTLGTLNCLEAIRLYAPNCRYFSAGSSLELQNNSIYSLSKSAAYELVKFYREKYNIFAIHCTLYTHTSERQSDDFVARKITKGVARIYKAVQEGEDFEPIVLGNLYNHRPFGAAKDFVEQIWLMMNSPEPKDYSLSSRNNCTISYFLELAFISANLKIKRIDNDGSLPINDPLGNQINYTINDRAAVVVNSKFYKNDSFNPKLIKQDFWEWEPKTSIEELVKSMVEYDIKNS